MEKKQLTFWSEEHHVNPSQSQDSEKDLKIREATLPSSMLAFLTSLNPSGSFGKTCQVSSVHRKEGTLVHSSGRWANSGMGSATECLMLRTSESHSEGEESLLSDILETGDLPQKYYLSQKACQGILRRAEKRGKTLPKTLELALTQVAHSKQEITKTWEQTDSTKLQQK